MGLTIHILCNDGSPLGVTPKSIYGEDGRVGIGGAELALLTMCELWHKRGDTVVLYNDPRGKQFETFEQRPISDYRSDDVRDVVIFFRSPNQRAWGGTGYRVWWSCDQYTVGDFTRFSKAVNQIVVISDFHRQYFQATYGIGGTTVIDLPVRTWEYQPPIEKIPKRCIFTSVPDRGLHFLVPLWAAIQRAHPDASLTITSDYRLWGTIDALNEKHRLKWVRQKNVRFLGAVNRRDLVQEQMQAQLHLYPCTYEELFCIAVAESQVAGALPITTDCGALDTTNMFKVIKGHPLKEAWQQEFLETVCGLLSNPELPVIQADLRDRAISRFRPERILNEWDTKVFYRG